MRERNKICIRVPKVIKEIIGQTKLHRLALKRVGFGETDATVRAEI